MKAKVAVLIAILLMVVSIKNVQATYTLTSDDVEVVDGIIISCSYNFSDRDIIIPSVLDGQTVIGIKDGLNNNYGIFANEWITSLVLPSTIEKIGDFAFYRNSIDSLFIPSSVKRIGDYAFSDNAPLDTVVFESNSNILFIGRSAFADAALTSVVLPSSHANPDFINYRNDDGIVVTSITNFFHYYYANIPYTLTDDDVIVINGCIDSCSYDFEHKNIIIPEILDRQMVKRIANGAYNKGVFSNKGITDVTFPETMENIGDYSFQDNIIVNINIPGSVTRIGNAAFYENKLDTLNIPNTVTEIGEAAFLNNSLKILTLPNSITIIKDKTFYGNDSLISVTIPSSVKTIGEQAFYRNKSLTSVSLPNSLEVIDEDAFRDCLLSNLTIPASVKSIGQYAFYSNDNLTNVNFESNSNIMLIDVNAFAGNTLLAGITLPTHANSTFKGYIDISNSIEYSPGNTITNFAVLYYTDALYTLTDDDVVVINGVIESSSYDSYYKCIKIPNELDGQTITGIADQSYNYSTSQWEAAFKSKDLSKVVLPSTLQKIGNSAFSDNNLTSLTIPNSVTEIGSSAFKNNSIVHLELSNTLSSLGSYVFYNNSIDSLVIPNSLTNIPFYAFNINSIDSLFIPSSISSIESYAFYNNSLTKVVFESPGNIRNIGTRAFSNNTGLTGIILPTNNNSGFIEYIDETTNDIYYPNDTIVSFNSSYFANILYTLTDDDVVVNNGVIVSCSYDHATYKSILIPDVLDGQTVIGIGEYVFSDKDLIYIQLPSTLKTIGNYAFESNDLTELSIPNSVTSIGEYAFNANSIKSVTLPGSIERINEGAFYSNAIDSITIPSSVNFIGAYAFRNNNLKHVVIPNSVNFIGSYAFYGNSIDSLVLSESITKISENAFRDNILTKVTIPNSVTNIGSYAFYGNNIDTLILSDAITSIGSYAFYNNSIDTLILPNGVTSIGQYAFRYNELTAIVIPENLEVLENYVFANNAIDSIVIPRTVKHINDNAFYSNNLKRVDFENNSNIVSIGANAFASNSSLGSITMPTHAHPDFIEYINESTNDVYNPGDIINDFTVSYLSNIPYTFTDDDVVVTGGVIKSCYYDFEYKNITIPDTLDNQKIIGIASSATNTDGIFYNKGILSINLPTYIETIGDYAFYANELKDIILPDSVKTIGIKAFYDNSITTANIGDNVVKIGDYAFALNNIATLTLPNSLTDISLGAFSSNQISSLTLGNAVTKINKQAFYNNSISSLIIPESVTFIGQEAFKTNELTSLTIPVSVKTIETEAFNNNDLSSVTFNPTSYISYIGDGAFNANNASLVSIALPVHANPGFLGYKKGDETDVTDITDFSDYYYANVPYTLTNDDVVVTNGIIDSCTYDFSYRNIIIPETLDGQTVIGIADGYKETTGFSTVYHGVFYNKDIISLKLPATLEFVGDYAFYFAGIKHIIFDDALESIGDYAFSYSSLTHIDFPNSLIDIGASSFFRCGTIDTLVLGNAVQIIGNNAFYDNEITKLTLPESLLKIGSQAFWDNSIDTLVIPNSVTNIGYRAFFQNNIRKLTLGSSVDTIKEEAFYYNYIEELDVPNSVIYIGDGAFKGHSSDYHANDITSITLGDSVKYIGDEAFYYCSLTNLSIPRTIEYIGEKAFMANDLSYLTIPSKIKFIGNYAFNKNKLNNVTFENNSNISYIGAEAFSENRAFLSSIILPTHANPNFVAYYDGNETEVTKITDFSNYYYADIPYRLTDDDVVVEDGIIVSCNYDFTLKNIIIPQTLDGQTVVGVADAFAATAGIFNNKGITKLQLPPTLNYIGNHAFGNNLLKELTIPNAVTSIGRNAFSGNDLITVNLSNSTKVIAYQAFSSNNLTSITIPKSVKCIEYGAFSSNKLTSVNFEDNSEISYIYSGAFSSNTSLTVIKLPTNANDGFKGYIQQDVSGYVTEITDFFKNYYADFPYTLTDDDVVVKDGYIIDYNKDIVYSSIVIPSKLDGQTVIGIADKESPDCIFCDIYLRSVKLPSTLQYIGDESFAYNEKLKNIVIPNSVKTIGEYAFSSSYDNNKITLGNSVETIRDYAFYDNNYVNEIILPETLKSIGEGAFSSNSIDSLVIPRSVESIGDQAFYRNTLLSVIFEDSSFISTIELQAFKDNSLTSIQLPDHASNNLDYYYDASMNKYNEGDLITNFETSYSAEIKPYTIIFKDYDGTVLSTQVIDHGDSVIAPPDPVHTGYIYNGWDSEFDVVLSDMIINALFTRINHITYNLDGGTNSIDNPDTYLITDDTITFAKATKPNYIFEGWYTESGFINQITEIPEGSEGDKTLWAKFSIKTYGITYNLDGGTNHASNPVSYSIEDSVVFENPNKLGYTFGGWYTESDFLNPVTKISLGSTGDVTVWAKFTPVDYLITYNLDGGNNHVLNPVSYTVNDQFILADPTKPYYNFDGWYSDASYTNTITQIPIGSTQDTTVYARFSIVNYAITYNLNGGTNGVNNPAGYTYESDTIILEDAVKKGYTFNGWYKDSYFKIPIIEIPKGSAGDMQLYAKFTINDYTITYYNGGQHSNPGTYNVNYATITLTNAVKEGYIFNGWFTDASFTTSITEIPAGSTGDLNIYAKFTPINYSITYNLDGGTNNPNNPESYTIDSALIVLQDPIKDGYTFNGWYTDAGYTQEITEIPQGSTGNVVVYAWFTMNRYSAIFNISDGTYAINGALVYFDGAVYTSENGVVSINGLINGTYSYTVKANGFNDNSGSFTINGNNITLNIKLDYQTSIDELSSTNIKIYPNPVNDKLYFELNSEYDGLVEMYTLTGSLIKSVKVNNEKTFEIDTDDIDRGLFLLKIDNRTFRLFKE